VKAYRIGKGNGRRWPKIALFMSIAAILLIIGAAVGVRTVYMNNLQARDAAANTDIIFVVGNGDTVDKIADGMEDQAIIRSAWAFTQYVRTRELTESFKAGTYRLKANMDVPEIAEILTEGKVAMDLFTILPGKRVEQIKADFLEDGFDETEVDRALNPELYTGHPALVDKPAGASLDGYLYPDSYQKIATTTPQIIIGQSLDEMAEALTPDIRAGISAQGLSVYRGIIMASLVEKEVSGNNPADRPQVAQVFLKRLELGMLLQSNATDALPDEYDTYSIEGLPPGPISNVTTSSLQAVATPAQSEYLYFVAGKDCVTRYSYTVEQHDQLKQQHGIARPEDKCI
jgi:UPF0755 protein